ncbi:TcaA second domain-containing protein [Fructilactobacillus cliffordii]|uniref:Zinc-ribbon domain-containing protein n=1 Tax=Fructilactobacillus cliffordii TaxID=2940299 RepID=A0A9Q8ZTE2_9LACO|nr:zinc ribbon domain-containing protein [Fructilactobacillus cliffordii]USS88998.1 hypothetical protein M3M40_05790 [Fructilactobacillus cliffordii]
MPKDQQFCPNCGHPVTSAMLFCPNCGQQLGEAASQQHQEISQTKRRPSKRLSYAILAIVMVLLVGGYAFGSHYYSKTATANRIVQSIANGNREQLAQESTTSDPSYKITPLNLTGLIKHFRANHQQFTTFQKELSRNNGQKILGSFRLQQTGRAFLLFPRYQLEITPVYGKLTSNGKKLQVLVDGQKEKLSPVQTSGSTKQTRDHIGPLTPGSHVLNITGIVDGKESNTEKNIDWLSGEDNYLSVELESKVASKTDARDALHLTFVEVGTGTIKYSSSGFVGEEQNPVYKEIVRMDDAWSNDPNIASFSADKINVLSTKPGKDNLTKVVFDVQYRLQQKDGTSKTQTMRYFFDVLPDQSSRYFKNYLIKDEFAPSKLISGNSN